MRGKIAELNLDMEPMQNVRPMDAGEFIKCEGDIEGGVQTPNIRKVRSNKSDVKLTSN